jgi:hypothetical protein
MWSIFEQVNVASAKYYSPTKHLGIVKIIVSSKDESFSKSIEQRNIDFCDKIL